MEDIDYGKLAIEYLKKYKGKIQIKPTLKINSMKDFSIVYTPGVAEVSKAINLDERMSWDLTWRWNTVFILTNGTRVLGLGDIGPLASLPVMEGKSLIYKELGGVNAVPIPIQTKNVDEFVNVVKNIAVTAGGIHLEDIESPFCFEVLERLQNELSVPVWHDDQQGTAAATLAGLINATKLADKDLKTAKIVMIGAGAANISLFNILEKFGVNPKNVILGDSKGPLYESRDDVEVMKSINRWKYEAMKKSNGDDIKEIKKSFENADIIIAFSREGAIKEDWIKVMNKKPIIFANANPNPEITPEKAKKAGAYIVSTGRSDYPNQINNSLIFPALFRGALDSRAKRIDDFTAISAAIELAKYSAEKGIDTEHIIASMEDKELYPRIASAVAEDSVKRGFAEIKEGKEYFYNKAKEIIGLN